MSTNYIYWILLGIDYTDYTIVIYHKNIIK
jgi:hypothetical protein